MATYHAKSPAHYAGKSCGNGHCVAFAREAADLGHTSTWKKGQHVRGLPADTPPGLVIATFDPDGTYGNHTDGRSHVAILEEIQAGGLLVWDQWVGHTVSQRVIRFKGGADKAVNDGDQYYVVSTAAQTTNV
jgi:hypothetical protein